MKAADLYSRLTLDGLRSSKLSTTPITADILTSVIGTPDQFLGKYERFQNQYFQYLKEGKLDPTKAGRVNIDTLMAGGKIDLSVLRSDIADQMKKAYIDDVLNLGTLFEKIGLPEVSLPSANLYRKAFRYQVDTELAAHPYLTVLNRTIFNVDNLTSGLSAFNPGVSNLMGYNSLRQSQTPLSSLFEGKTVYTFDVETTGVFSGSQVRSMAISQMKDGNISVLDDYNLSYASRQLGGIEIGSLNSGSRSMSEFLMQTQGGTRMIPDSKGGTEFLDEFARFFNKLTEADIVAGHNIYFDIQSSIDTATQMPGYHGHTAAREAVANFNKKMQSGNFIVDTLEYSRAYLNADINRKMAEKFGSVGSMVGTDAERMNAFRNLMYSPEFLARVKPGKSAATASVEAIAMNTNLLDLIEKEALQGHEGAQSLFDKIYKGTHMADTDSELQSYVAKYISVGYKDINDPFALRVVDQQQRAGFSSLVRGAQSKIFRSSAITPTTNIADVQHISRTVFNYVTNEGLGRVSVMATPEDLVSKGIIDSADISGDLTRLNNVEGVLDFDGASGKRVFKFAGQDIQVKDTGAANRYVGDILRNAADDSLSEEVSYTLNTGAKRTLSKRVNRHAEKVVDLNVNYLQANQIDEIKHIIDHASTLRGAVDENSMLRSIGQTYKLFGSGMTVGDALKRDASGAAFEPGLNNYTRATALAAAQAAAGIGSPYKYLDVNSRVFSTIMSEASSSHLQEASDFVLGKQVSETISGADALRMEREAKALRYAKNRGLLSEIGVSHFRGQSQFRMIGESGDVALSRLFVPLQVMESALGKETLQSGKIGLSFVQNQIGGRLNAFWKMKAGSSKDEYRNVIQSIFDFIQNDKSELKNISKETETQISQSLAQTRARIGALKTTGLTDAQIVDSLTERAMEGGLGIGYMGEKESARALKALQRKGMVAANDVMLGMQGDVIDAHADGNFLSVGAMYEPETVRANAEFAESIAAGTKELRDGKLGELSDTISGFSSRVQRTLKYRLKRSKIGLDPKGLMEKYIANKGNIRNAAIGLAIAGVGYYSYKKYKEKEVYDETIVQQPIQTGSTRMTRGESLAMQGQLASFRRDPLVTAGVVGNLDRNKISHYRMGNDKYNHLYSGV